MTLSVRQLTPGFAAEISGIDCRQPLSEADVAAIRTTMDRFGVVVLHGQNITDEEQLRFSLKFGAIEQKGPSAGRIHFRTDQEARTLGTSIGDFSNLGPRGETLTKESRAYSFKLADRLWHSDSSFKAVPAMWSILSGRSVPSWGGNTEFADMRAAYDALDDRWRREIEDLVCLHSNMYSREKIGFNEFSEAERLAFRPVRQRLVRVHPATGRKSLFLSSHAGAIEGMSIPDARMLLHDLMEFATQKRFVYAHAWRLHDLVIWDNRATMHRGTRFDPAEPRDIRQTRLAGDGPTIEQVA
jgi:alpha-ketoglutarate-dependent 2,4-dichlorophenoxyacetate dioxygenase